MKRLIQVSTLVLVMTGSAWAQDQSKVTNTPHNLNNGGWGISVSTPQGANQVCLPCHVPHNAYPDEGGTINDVLWNHQETGLAFTMYPTDLPQSSQPEGASKMCLSCHDGVTAIDSYGGTTGTVTLAGRPSAIGEDGDLTDDHPIGVTYPVGAEGYHDPTNFTGVVLVSINGDDRVECTSCHDPHNNILGAFLRRTLDESLLCLECHDK